MSSLALSYQEDPGLEKQIAHAETQDSVVGDVTIEEDAKFPEGGTQAWMAVIGVWVVLKVYDEYNDSFTDSRSFLVQFSTFGYMFPNMCFVRVLKISS
jgi:hypothetical protein